MMEGQVYDWCVRVLFHFDIIPRTGLYPQAGGWVLGEKVTASNRCPNEIP